MPKYTVNVKLSASFIFDTDDYLGTEEDSLLTPKAAADSDLVYDYVRNLIEDDGINEFDEPTIDEVEIKLKP